MATFSKWILVLVGLTACGPSNDEDISHDVCGREYLEAPAECSVATVGPARLPQGLWVGALQTQTPEGDVNCGDFRVEITNNEILMERIYEDVVALSYERWEFVDAHSAQILNHNGVVIGEGECSQNVCHGMYYGTVEGSVTWRFTQNLVEYGDRMNLAGASETYTTHAVVEEDCVGTFHP